MYFCVFKDEAGLARLGCSLDAARTEVVDLTAGWPADAAMAAPRDVADLARGGDAALGVARAVATAAVHRHAVSSLTLLAPVVRPARNVFCVGRNYRKHIIEGNIARGAPADAFPSHIEFFTKAPTTVIGPEADIPLHAGVTPQLDYEVELAIIMGQPGADIEAAQAVSHVFGYTVANDITGRDLQRRHGQWFKGKSLDRSCPLGPWVVHRSAGIDPMALGIRLRVNGELRQEDSTSEMIFPVADVIAQLSAGLSMEPGDVIITGTPCGVGYAMQPPRFLQDGDVVEAEIDGIGVLRNTVRA